MNWASDVTREELAWEIFSKNISMTFKDSFKLADEFLAEKKREPKACDHKFNTKIGDFGREWIHCLKCGEKKQEPPKPERKAREWYLKTDTDTVWTVWDSDVDINAPHNRKHTWIKVQEILPGDEK